MHKVKNVINLLLLLPILFFYSSKSVAQEELEGKYLLNNNDIKDSFMSFLFSKDYTFIYEFGGHLGVTEYGRGHYLIRNDSLILNYDLTELKENSYHIVKDYYNNNDSIEVKIRVFDINKNPLTDILVDDSTKKENKKTNQNGSVLFRLDKEKKKNTIYITDDKFGVYFFTIWNNKSYEIEVFFEKNPIGATPIKGRVAKYKIIELTDNKIKLKNNNQVIKFSKKLE